MDKDVIEANSVGYDIWLRRSERRVYPLQNLRYRNTVTR
jgi:hypothetical protein